ncbi:MAG TPA: 3-mercaptopyruvate sulfurtransferase [Stellaceae bacterium]|jgi:thiosulfate/3-mercaptopyruvate sulfurtransferase
MPYAHPEALVSTEWLVAHLGDADLRVVDGSFKMPGVTPLAIDDYRARHIPGAVYFDIDRIADHRSTLPHMLPGEAAFAASMSELGIGDSDMVVVYDAAGLVSAARAWWMLRAFGHKRVAILDGGLPKWLSEGRPVTTDIPTPTPRPYNARFNPALVRTKAALLANLTSKREQVLDARTKERYEGAAPEPWPGRRPGRIPGSLNLPYGNLTDPRSKTFLPAAELQKQFDAAGATRDKPVVTSCGSGVTACVLAFGLYLTGRDDVAVYDGSWAEWGLPGDTPVATGKP